MRSILLAALCLLLAPAIAQPLEVTVIGLTAGKAVIVVDGGKPRTLRAGETSPEGVRLVSADSESAVLEVQGRRKTLSLGHHSAAAHSTSTPNGTVSLTADSRGHFITTGTVNGVSTRFMVDTGASVVALSVEDAKRAGVNYLAGTRGRVQTANGPATVYMVKLDAVRVGDIVVNGVDAAVLEGGRLPIALLGMSFLNRMEMKRSGDTLMLNRRY